MKITQTQAKIGTVLVALLLGLSVVAVSPGSAQVSNQSTELNEFEDIAVTIDYSGSTDSTITIDNSSGSTVVSETVSGSSDTINKMYNLEQGTYSVSVSSTDETVVNSYTVESQSSLSLERTETVEVDSTDSDIVSDVEFSGNTSALVEVKSSGTVVYDERLDATDVSSTEWQTVTYSPATTGNFTVDISAEDLSAVNQTAVEMDSGAVGGIVGGASQTQLIAFVLIAGGLVIAYREDYI